MGVEIVDGTGKGYVAGVSSDNRLFSSVRTTELIEHITDVGRSFNVISGVLTLTTASESGILYIKNTNPLYTVELYSLTITFGKSTGSTNGSCTVRLYKNPTGGTLLSGTTNTPINRNFSISIPAIGTFNTGAEGNTVTGGTLFDLYLQSDYSSRLVNYRSPFMPNGSGLAISVQPPTGNTSMTATVTAVVNYLDTAQV